MRSWEYGLVLSGGGSRGAYQIGVLKALEEMGIMKNVTAIAGISIGALNAALYIEGGIERIESVWKKVDKNVIQMNTDINEIWNSGVFKRDWMEETLKQINLSKITDSNISFFMACQQLSERFLPNISNRIIYPSKNIICSMATQWKM